MRCPGTPTHPLKYPQVPQGPDATPLPLQGSPGGGHGPGRIPPGIPRGGPEAHPELPFLQPGHTGASEAAASRAPKLPLAAAAALQIRLWSSGGPVCDPRRVGELWGFSTVLLVSVFSGPFSGHPHPHPDTGRRGKLSGLRLVKRCRLLGVLRGPPRRSLQLPHESHARAHARKAQNGRVWGCHRPARTWV